MPIQHACFISYRRYEDDELDKKGGLLDFFWKLREATLNYDESASAASRQEL